MFKGLLQKAGLFKADNTAGEDKETAELLKKNRVYFPVESLVGLGHFNRTGKLVREMVSSGLEVSVASGTFVDEDRFFAGARTIALPAYVFTAGSGDSFTLGPDGTRTILPEFNERAQENARIKAHLDNIERRRPNILITEFWPFDRSALDREMESLLIASKMEAVKASTRLAGDNSLRLISVRDVMDTPNEENLTPEELEAKAACEEWTVNMINDNYHAVLVHGDPRFISLSETFAAADKIKAEIIYTGYVIDDLSERAVANGNAAPFLVSCGSGVDGQEMIFSFLTAWEKLLERAGDDVRDLTSRPVHIICGPRFAGEHYENVCEWADDLRERFDIDICVEKYRTDFTSLLAKASFSLSLAGYNTTLETLAIGTPALFIPKYAYARGNIAFSLEQMYRLERLQEKGFASYAHPSDVQNAELFAGLLLKAYKEQTAPGACDKKPQLNFNGAKNTMAAITRLLEEKRDSGNTLVVHPARPVWNKQARRVMRWS